MNTNLNSSFSFQDQKIQNYLYDRGNTSTLRLEPISENGFSNEVQDRRLNNFFPSYSEDIPFIITEEWVIEEITYDSSGTPIGAMPSGVAFVDVIQRQSVKVNTEYWVFFKNNISEEAKRYGRGLLASFNPTEHGNDLESWIKSQLNSTLTEDMFTLEVCICIDKVGSVNTVNDEQRKILERIYNGESGPSSSEIHLIGDQDLKFWAHNRKLRARWIGDSLKSDQSHPIQTKYSREVTPPKTAENSVDDIVLEITKILIPSQCGAMEVKNMKLLTLYEWPEFKTEWKRVKIKIGCSTIVFSIPIIRIRMSKMVLYIHYSLPKSVDRTMLKIVEICAIRSALGATVVGIVLWNPGAALAAFQVLFKKCIELEIKNCVDAGVLTIKEAGAWH